MMMAVSAAVAAMVAVAAEARASWSSPPDDRWIERDRWMERSRWIEQ
jgi:hypothetical protein